MQFVIKKESETGVKLTEHLKEIERCVDVAENYIRNSFGCDKHFGQSHFAMKGGISCVELDEKPEGWKSVGKRYLQLFTPKANTTDKKEIDKLPVVKYSDRNEIIGFTQQFVGVAHVKTYGVEQNENEDSYVIEIYSGSKYEPLNDVKRVKSGVEVATKEVNMKFI